MAEHERIPVTSPQEAAPAAVHIAPPVPGRSEYLALRALQIGAIAVVLAAVTWKEYELDRFYVPKELVLHVTAVVAGLAGLRAIRRLPFTRIDVLLTAFVLAGSLSAFFSENGWLAVRALAASASGVVIYWTARALRRAGLARSLLGAIALAVVVGTGTSLLQTYGVETDFFSINRAPGGTLGNRNSIAHMAAFGLPIILLVSLRATSWTRWLIAGIGAMLAAATLVLTRSRAGFLACGAVLVVLLAALAVSPTLRRHGRTWLRVIVILVLAGAGIAAATLMPNALNWRSDNPYLESLTGVANYQEGSGRGRLVQYRQSLRMASAHPVLGVGPGNWPVVYPDYAADGDPSLDSSEPGMTSNPWPSSDWIAFVSERGFAAAVLLMLALAGMGIQAVRQLVRGQDPDEALGATALLAMLLAATVAGMFDAVLLLALPTLLVFAAAGALAPLERAGEETEPFNVTTTAPAAIGQPRSTAGTAAVIVLLFIAAVGALRSAAQLTAMGVYANSSSTTWLSRASFIDPGGYRLHVRLARRGSGLGREARCEHALAARDLFPNAREARNLSSGCD
ncbi:MAG TPA: O-antigen ligase family protein [Longimicrobiales bacterium]|nr:O-antigen ligase family protein [Longimicrobiales bacterium]